MLPNKSRRPNASDASFWSGILPEGHMLDTADPTPLYLTSRAQYLSKARVTKERGKRDAGGRPGGAAKVGKKD